MLTSVRLSQLSRNKSGYYQQPITCCTSSGALWGAAAFQQWGPCATAGVKFVLGLLSEYRSPSPSGAFLRLGETNLGIEMRAQTSHPFHFSSKKTQNTKSLVLLHGSAPLTGSLCKHKVSVKFCFLQPKGLTGVCSVSLVCDVRSWIRFKDVPGCMNHLLT